MRIKTLTALAFILLSAPYTIAQERARAIRAVDFKNFSYPACVGTKTGPLSKAKEVSLHNGELEVGDLRKKEEPVNISVSNVSYSDLTGDGQEEAIVTLVYLFYPHGSAGCTFIYAPGGNRPRLLWQEGFERLRRLAIENRGLTFEDYPFSASDAYCCPKKYLRTFYRWNGKRFAKVRQQTLANEFENGRFLGYP
jgi:hypothetical protein